MRGLSTEARPVDAHNRQIEINTITHVRINELTNTVNQRLKALISAQVNTGHLYEMLRTRNRIMVMKLQNLMKAILLQSQNLK